MTRLPAEFAASDPVDKKYADAGSRAIHRSQVMITRLGHHIGTGVSRHFFDYGLNGRLSKTDINAGFEQCARILKQRFGILLGKSLFELSAGISKRDYRQTAGIVLGISLLNNQVRPPLKKSPKDIQEV